MKKRYKTSSVLFAQYKKINSNKKLYGPFIINKIENVENNEIRIIKNIYGTNLVAMLSPDNSNMTDGYQESYFECLTGDFYSLGNRKPNIIISKYLTVSEIIMLSLNIENCNINRSKLLEKHTLNTKDILSINKMIQENPEVFGFETEESKKQSKNSIKQKTINNS